MEGYQIPLPKDMAMCQTTMTVGVDVANAIAALIGNERAIGQVFNIIGTEHMAWQDVLDIYQNVLDNVLGTRTRVYSPQNSVGLYLAHGNKYQYVYDRLYNRTFDNSKLQIASNGTLTFHSMKDGLTKCVNDFAKNPRWKDTSPRLEAYLDKTIGEKPNFSHFSDNINKLKYFMWYYTPGMMNIAKRIIR